MLADRARASVGQRFLADRGPLLGLVRIDSMLLVQFRSQRSAEVAYNGCFSRRHRFARRRRLANIGQEAPLTLDWRREGCVLRQRAEVCGRAPNSSFFKTCCNEKKETLT